MAQGFDYSKLTGKLYEIAEMADNQGKGDARHNGKLEGEEVSIFETNAKLHLGKEGYDYTQDDINSVLGFEKKAVETTTTPEAFSKKDSKAQEKAYDTKGNVILDHLETMVGEKPEKVMQALKEDLGNGVNEKEYQVLLSQVETILNKVNEVRAQSGVKHLEKNVKKSFPKGTLDDFGKDVLKVLVKNAENAQSSKAYDEISKAYEEKRAAGMGRKEAYEAVKKEYKNKSPEHKEILRKRGMFNQNKSAFEANYIMKEAREDARAAIYESDETTSRKVKKDAKNELKADKNYDKYTRRALNGENNLGTWASGQDSNMKIVRQNQARGNRVEKAKTQTEAEIRKAVGDELFEHLKNSGMIEAKDGKYDLTALSDTIKREVGSDLYMDRMSKEKDAIAEKQLTYNRLRAKLGLTEKQLSNSDAKKLVELCGFEIQGNGKLVKALYRGTVGAVLGGLSAGGAEAARKRADAHYNKAQNIESSIHIDTKDLDNITGKTIIDGKEYPLDKSGINIKVPEGASDYAQTIVDVAVNVDILKDFIFKGGKFVLSNALKGAMIGGAIGALSGLLADGKDEIPVASINIKCSTLKEYVDSLQGIKPEWRDILTTIAATFTDGKGNWDCNGYQEFLKQAAGNDILNKKELLGALKTYETELKNKKPEKPEEKPEEKTVVENPVVPEAKEDCHVEYKEDIKMTDSNKYTWGQIVNMYYKDCLGKHTAKEIWTKLKQYNNIPSNVNYIPAGIALPYDLFGDGECERTERQNVKRVKVKRTTRVKKFNGQLGDTGVQARNVCKNRDGSYTTTDWSRRHKDRAGAEKEARENGWIK